MFSTSVVNYNTGADFPIPSEAEHSLPVLTSPVFGLIMFDKPDMLGILQKGPVEGIIQKIAVNATLGTG